MGVAEILPMDTSLDKLVLLNVSGLQGMIRVTSHFQAQPDVHMRDYYFAGCDEQCDVPDGHDEPP